MSNTKMEDAAKAISERIMRCSTFGKLANNNTNQVNYVARQLATVPLNAIKIKM